MKKLLIFDLSNFIFRAFFAIRPLSANDGTPVNAVYGVLNMILNALEDLSPDHVVMAMDSKEKSFRNELYTAYKANRSSPPDDLIPQFELIAELVDHLGIAKIKIPGVEADDIIGSLVTQFANDFEEILIASSDKDLMQFIGGNIKMIDTMKGKIYSEKEVIEKMGVRPSQIVDYLSLTGDSSDNIPGVKGIGAKGAAKLLAEFDTLENVLENAESIKNKRILNGLISHREDAILSKKLVSIKCDCDLDLVAQDLKYILAPSDNLKGFFERLNFKSSLKKVFKLVDVIEENDKEIPPFESPTNLEVCSNDIQFIKKQFEAFVENLQESVQLALYCNDDYFAVAANNIHFYIELNHVEPKYLAKLIGKSSKIYSLVAKKVLKLLNLKEITSRPVIFDIPMAHFNIDASSKHDEKFLIERLLNLDFDNSITQKIRLTLELGLELEKKIKERNLNEVYEQIDLPLNDVLVGIEQNGMLVDCNYLYELEKEYTKTLDQIEAEIKKDGDENLNLRSPKQVGSFLFEKLNLPVIKKTKTGYSTDQSVLVKLDQMGISEIPGKILQFRETEKLLSTYIKTLPLLVNPNTKRVHTSLEQSVAATGRLSSVNPNLQNIPTKSELGRRIRKAFIAPKDYQLLSADYSQVELRILAHFCQDETMLSAFKNNRDIHSETAVEVFGADPQNVARELRSKAKAINFGLMYGQSSYGLSEALGIDRFEAKEYITHYFEKFSKVKMFLDKLKEECEKTGMATTILGRQRLVPEIHSKNRTIKSFGDRIAINSPIQGTAADIIKLAMIKIDQQMKSKFPKSKMILQVHDELIFEAHISEVNELEEFVKNQMQEAYTLSVPLKVETITGPDWYELK
jgi:DNA polymerase-1